jgi:uncharacterized protein YceH (UPF0502 family)
MLRGPQTPGELKQRTERMHRFADLEAVHTTLEALISRRLVKRLQRRPGHKEERYIELLGESDEDPSHQPSAALAQPALSAPQYADELAARVERLEREVAELRAAVGLRSGELIA